jgi:hypothetical protein
MRSIDWMIFDCPENSLLKSLLTSLCQREGYSSPFEKGGLRGIFIVGA